MQLSSWLGEFRQRVRAARRQGRRIQAQMSAEMLETKTLLTVTGVLIGTELRVFLDSNDSVAVRRGNTGRVEVVGNGAVINTIPNISATALTSLLIDASDSDNVIDTSAMTTAQFPALSGITLDGGNGTDRITGSNGFAESILGGDGNDILIGNDGNDTINGGHGNDSITAGNGADVVLGNDGRDTIDTGIGNDSIIGGDGDDLVTAGDGDDTVDASQGADNIDGGNGNDSIIGGFGNDTVNGGAGNDTIFGGADADSILGGAGNDLLTGNAGNDTIAGEAGDDSLDGDDNNDSLDGGDGNDTLNGGTANDTAVGGAGSDIFYGGGGNDSLDGQGGNDTVNGNGGDDTVIGGPGSDLLNGQAGNDLVFDSDFVAQTLPTLSVGNASVAEGNSGTTTATFTITLSTASAVPVTVSYSTVNGTADASDFAPINTSSVTFAPGEISKSIAVSVIGDTTAEVDEVFFFALANPVNALLATAAGTGSITNDDGTGIRLLGSAFSGEIYELNLTTAAPTLIANAGFFGIQDFTVGIGNVLYTTIQYPNGAPPVAPLITLATVDRTTALATLIGAFNPQPANFIEGALGFDVTQNAIFASFTGDDPRLYRVNPANGASVDLGPLLFGGAPVTGFYNVDSMAFRGNELFLILETGPNPQLVNSLLRIDTATREITRIGPMGVTLTNFGSGMAYDQTTDSFLFIDGSPTVPSTLYRVNATTGAATVIGNTGIFDMTGLTLDVAQQAPQVGVSINDASVVEGTGGTNSLNFTLTLDRTPTAPVVVSYTTINGAAQAGADFTGTTASVTFSAGQTSQTVSIPISPDSTGEGNESFFVRLTSVTGGAILDGIAIGTIIDDDVDFASNTLRGGTGNDTIRGGLGDDVINGDEDNDVIDGRDGNDSVLGGSGNDSITGGNGDDTVNGQVGNDTLDGGSGNDAYVWDAANAGQDVLADTLGFQTLQINGTTGIDNFVVGKTSTLLKVSRGTASITTNTTISNVTINGDTGDDTFTVQSLTGVLPLHLAINGGDGNDTVTAAGVSLGNVRFGANGDNDNDTLIGSLSGDTLNGGNGDDSINGDAGNDTVLGGDGADIVNSGDGHDLISGDGGPDSLLGGAGNDTISGGDGDDYGDGQDGNDSVSGGNGNDTTTGSAGNDTLRGDGGGDAVLGGSGNDFLDGGVGNDFMRGHTGNDQIKGGDGNDTITGDAGIDTIDGGDGDDSIDGGFGLDSLPGGVGGIISGGNGNDTLLGGVDDDTIIAGDGHDLVIAAAGQDMIFGGDGDDTLSGNGGTDTFNGGEGTNTLDAVAPERDNQNLVISTSVLQALAILSGL